MSDVLRFGKKLFTWSVVAMTIAWSVGLSALVPAGDAQAAVVPVADVEAGDLIKLENQSAVYYINEDMERMYFATDWMFYTWFPVFDQIKTVPAGTDLDAYLPPATRGVVSPRMGSCESMKSPASPAVYVASYGGVRHKLASEAAAVALCGADWARHVHDLPDFIISLFPLGGELDGSTPFPGQLIRSEANGPVYVVGADSKAYAVEGSLPAFLAATVRMVTQDQWDNLAGMGEGNRTVASLTADVAQLSGEPSGDDDEPNDNESTGDLRVSLAGNTAEGDVVPGGAQNVEYVSVVLQAVGGDVELDSLTFHRGGVGDSDDFDKVYLYHDGMRLENGRSLNTDDEVTFNVNLHIEQGDSETLVVKADMETVDGPATEGDQNRFELRGEDDIDASGADVSGSFPIRGNLMEVGSQDIGTIEVTAGGTDTTAKIGEDDVKVGEFDVEASSEDVSVTSITLQQKGTIDLDALSNVVLKQGGTTVATGEMMDDDKVRFEFEESDQIEEGDSVTYRVYADVGIADTDDTIQFILDEDSDLSAWSEDNAGYEVGVTNTDLDAAGAMEITLEGGKINVDFEGESTEVRQDQSDASFGTFTILSTAEDLDVDSMDFVLNKTANTLALEDMKLRDKNGRGTYSLEATSTIGAASATWTVTVEDLSLEQGVAYEFEVIGDVPSTATSNYSYYFTWDADDVDAEGVSSDNAIEADDFSSASLTGPTVDVDTSSLVVRSSALSDDTVVNGTRNVLLYRGTLEAGSTSDVAINSMTFGTSSASNAWSNRLNGVKLFVVGLNETVDPTADEPVATDNTVSSNEAIFDGVDVTVLSGSANRMKFEVYGDITDGSSTGDLGLELTDVDASDEDDEDVTAEDSSGNAITGLESDRVITIAGTGTLSMVVDTDYNQLKNDRYALAGTEKFLAGRVKLQADREDVIVQDLAIRFVTTSPTADFSFDRLDASIDTISLYSNPSMADNTLLGTADFSATTTIEDVDYTVADGETHYLYFGLKLNSVGTAADGTAIPSTSFKFAVAGTGQDVKGADSNDDITPSVTATQTNDINVNPVLITDVSSDFAGGTLVGGNQNIFSFKVTADAGRNTDEDGDVLSAHLQRLGLQLSTDVGGSGTSNTSALQLCRVDSGNCITLGTTSLVSSTNTTVTLETSNDGYIDVTDFTDANDEYVDDGETAEFVVKGTFANVTDHFVQVKLVNLNSNGLRYGVDTDSDGTDDYEFSDIRKEAPRGTDYPSVTGKALTN